MAGDNGSNTVQVDLITNPEDVIEGFRNCAVEAFCRQVQDSVFIGMNPGWDTPEGLAKCAARNVERWRTSTKDSAGHLNTIFLKATLPNHEGKTLVVGCAIWVQLSIVDGYGDKPETDLSKTLKALYPDNENEQLYLQQAITSLHRRRTEVVKEKMSSSPPSVMVLDMCSVNPVFQRRGIAGKLVQWGLDEAARRGGLECLTEASAMGRQVYGKMGFKQEGGEIDYVVDEQFSSRIKPSNVFMRTGHSG